MVVGYIYNDNDSNRDTAGALSGGALLAMQIRTALDFMSCSFIPPESEGANSHS